MAYKLLSVLSTIALAQAAVIVPGASWTDTEGNVIQAHGGGFLKACFLLVSTMVILLGG